MALLELRRVTTAIRTGRGEIRPVDDVSFALGVGETLCLVGESGSGKSMTALSIMRLLELELDTSIEGTIEFKGQDLTALSQSAMAEVRGREMAMVFQEPMTALNPVLTIGRQLDQVERYHRRNEGRSRRGPSERVMSTLAAVGIPDPGSTVKRYPHQLSGGMRQRVVIAMALLGNPSLLIADEPTTALDVTTQAGILELLGELQSERGMALLLITHDMGVAAEIASRVAVMYAGKLVEVAAAESLFSNPRHPYTKGLLASVPPIGGDRQERLPSIPGNVPQLDSLPSGCRFAPRCRHATEICWAEQPSLEDVASSSAVACWHSDDLVAET